MLLYLAQAATSFDQSYDFQSNTTTSTSLNIVTILIGMIAVTIILVAAIVGMWKLFEKAGQKGWKALIPLYNSIIILRIVGFSGWLFLVYLIPFVTWILFIVVCYRLAKSFGFGIGMTILNIIGIGYLIIGFGKSTYLGPNGVASPGEPKDPQAPATPVAPAAPAPPKSPISA